MARGALTAARALSAVEHAQVSQLQQLMHLHFSWTETRTIGMTNPTILSKLFLGKPCQTIRKPRGYFWTSLLQLMSGPKTRFASASLAPPLLCAWEALLHCWHGKDAQAVACQNSCMPELLRLVRCTSRHCSCQATSLYLD